jgi:FkbH-like protein
MTKDIRPSLNNEEHIIPSLIKKKKIELLINYLNSFILSQNNKNKCFNFLENESKKSKSFKKISVLIISNMSYQVFNRLIKEKCLTTKYSATINYIDYNKFLITDEFKIEYDFVLVFFDKNDLEEISSFANNLIYKKKHLLKIKDYYNLIFKKLLILNNAKIFVSNFSPYENTEFFSLEKKIKNNKNELINNLNNYILKKAIKNKFNLIDIDLYSKYFGLTNIHDNVKFYLAKIPFTQEFAEFLFSRVANLIQISLGKIKKVLVVDLDNTLWGGILGDDGHENIIIDNQTSEGKVFFDLQKTILNLKKRGILLVACSKNYEKNVKNAFKYNSNLVLKYNDFVSIKTNWNNKAENILNISKELNLSLDSFVFFDDNPAERELVRNLLPSISIPELPNDPSYFKDILLNNFYFDLLSLSKEDATRSRTYAENIKREKLKKKFYNLDDYFKSLEMKCQYSAFKNSDYERIMQLFLRSNQFNFTTIRYSLKDIANIAMSKIYSTFQFHFTDKFSNYGIISLMVCKIKKNILYIDNWVMSCRVLNRTLENFILNTIVKYCKKVKIEKIIGVYIPTKKNFLVKNTYKNLGFINTKIQRNYFEFIYYIKNHKDKKTLVEEKK